VPGGLNPNKWDKFAPKPSANPPPQKGWNERLFPREWPLAHYERSKIARLHASRQRLPGAGPAKRSTQSSQGCTRSSTFRPPSRSSNALEELAAGVP